MQYKVGGVGVTCGIGGQQLVIIYFNVGSFFSLHFWNNIIARI